MSDRRSEELRQQGFELLNSNEPERALEVFDAALREVSTAGQAERLTANRCLALIALERFDDPAFGELPKIVLRRSDLSNVYSASYTLAVRYRGLNRLDRAAHYARIAADSANALGHNHWSIDSLSELGNVAVLDSRFDEARSFYLSAIDLLDEEEGLRKSFLLHNLGYCELETGNPAAAVELIARALEMMRGSAFEGFSAEPHLDLAVAYLELGMLEEAKLHAEVGLENSREIRQERNAHYLLGEIAHAMNDMGASEAHFASLCEHYPEFPQLKNLLYALDFRKVINWKL